MNSLLEPPKVSEPCQHLDFSSVRPVQTSDLQDYKISCCWSFSGGPWVKNLSCNARDTRFHPCSRKIPYAAETTKPVKTQPLKPASPTAATRAASAIRSVHTPQLRKMCIAQKGNTIENKQNVVALGH